MLTHLYIQYSVQKTDITVKILIFALFSNLMKNYIINIQHLLYIE